MEKILDQFIRGRERRIEAIARDLTARFHRKNTGTGKKRREYHNLYYWQHAEKRRQQRLSSHQQLGKAHRYTEQLRQEERRNAFRSSKPSTNMRESL